LMFLRISVARLLSSQKPGERDNCLSWFILSRLLSTSKKPPQDHYTVPHSLDLFLCHKGAKIRIPPKAQNAAGGHNNYGKQLNNMG
jgi:hypothetical protein